MMTLKRFSVITLVCGLILTVVGLIISFLMISNNDSAVGIIGGASLPTYFYMLNSLVWLDIILDIGFRLIVISLFCFIFGRYIKTNCSISASILSLGISAAVALLVNFGYMCVQIVFLGMIQDNVLRFIIGVLLSAVGLVISVILMCQYIQLRKKEPKWVGILIDILTVFITFPLFSYVFSSIV